MSEEKKYTLDELRELLKSLTDNEFTINEYDSEHDKMYRECTIVNANTPMPTSMFTLYYNDVIYSIKMHGDFYTFKRDYMKYIISNNAVSTI